MSVGDELDQDPSAIENQDANTKDGLSVQEDKKEDVEYVFSLQKKRKKEGGKHLFLGSVIRIKQSKDLPGGPGAKNPPSNAVDPWTEN